MISVVLSYVKVQPFGRRVKGTGGGRGIVLRFKIPVGKCPCERSYEPIFPALVSFIAWIYSPNAMPAKIQSEEYLPNGELWRTGLLVILTKRWIPRFSCR